MQIHNYYSDLLLSITKLFDRIIFPGDFIKSYSFNFSNRTFELSKKDFKTQFELPAAIINYNEDNYSFGERTTVALRMPIENMNMIPVIKDLDTGTVVYVQEEHISATFSITINCESALQAKEIEFHIKRYLPQNKYIMHYDFNSFLEIPVTVLSTLGIDVHTHEIVNLFTRMNKNIGEVEYCFGINYKPLIRLDSISTSIDKEQRSFPVTLDITYQIQMPMWLCWDVNTQNKIEKISLDFTRFGMEPISENNCKTLFYIQDNKHINKKIKRNLIISDLDQFNLIRLKTDMTAIFIDDTDKDIYKILMNSVVIGKIKIQDLREFEQTGKSENPNLNFLLSKKLIDKRVINNFLKSGLFLHPILTEYLYTNKISIDDIRRCISNKKTSHTYLKEFLNNKILSIDDLSNYLNTLNTLEDKNSIYSISIHFDESDFIISDKYEISIFDINGKIHSNYIKKDFDRENNTLILEFSPEEYLKNFKATLTRPIIVQFIQVMEDE